MILYSRWIALPLPTRNKLAELFSIIKKGSTEVSSNIVKYDGYIIEDIEKALTKEAMEKFLGFTFNTPELLWEAMVNKVEGKDQGLRLQILEVLPAKEAIQFKKERRKRVTKNVIVKATLKKTKKENEE